MAGELFVTLFLVLLGIAQSFFLIMATALMLEFLTKGAVPITNAMIAESVAEDGTFEGAYSVNSVLMSIANTVAPILFGVLAETLGIQSVFFASAVVAASSTIPAFMLVKSRRS